jgi:hypothetical protein
MLPNKPTDKALLDETPSVQSLYVVELTLSLRIRLARRMRVRRVHNP